MKKIFLVLFIGSLALSCSNTKESIPTAQKKEAASTTETPTLQRAPQDPALHETVENGGVTTPAVTTKIEWLDFETAIALNKENPKNIFIDVYTEWCGWCKKMDGTTFVDPQVVAYMNEHFYAVKMDAESKTAIAYNGQLYEYQQFNAKAGYNTLAVSLLDSQMSFPSFVVLDKKEVKKGKMMGYKPADAFLIELKKYVK